MTAEPVWARISSPHYHAAAMDGYAVRSEETRGASETSPLLLRVGEQAIPVDTGDPLPLGMNAVIMIENTQPGWQEGVDYIEILSAVAPWADVRPMGEDMVATELVLPANHRLRPQDVGAIAGSGHTQVTVYRRPRVAILPTGTELVKPGSALQPGDIIEYHSLMLGAQAEEAGCVVTRLPIQADDYASIKAAVVDALRRTTGRHQRRLVRRFEDYTSTIVRELGELRPRHRHPARASGRVGVAQGKALVGVPGFPSRLP